MDYLSGTTGTFYRITDWIMKFTAIHIIWLLFNFPIVYVVISSLFIGEMEIVGFLIILLAILFPILFFPSTMALFATVRAWIIRKGSSGLLIKAFWRYYQVNYKRSVQAGSIFTILWVIWLADIYFLVSVHVLFVYLFIVMGIFLFVYMINFFSTNVHYAGSLRTVLKNALIITVTRPALFISVLFSHVLIIYISLYAFRFLLFFFTATLIVYVSFSAFNQFYIKKWG